MLYWKSTSLDGKEVIGNDLFAYPAGKSIQLTAEITPTDKKNPSVTWSSSNEKVATVSKKGVVTFKKNTGGKSVTITASVKGGKKATFKITIK